MTIRKRKLIGTIATILYLIIYCLAAMMVGNAVVTKVGGLGQAVFFVAAGFAWLPVAMALVRWMQRPDEP